MGYGETMQVQRKAEPGPWGKNESTVFGANRREEQREIWLQR